MKMNTEKVTCAHAKQCDTKTDYIPKRQKMGIEGHRKYEWTVCCAGKRPAGRQRMSIQSDVPHPPPERKVNENGGLGGDGEVVRIISGIIWGLFGKYWRGVVIGYGGVFPVYL